MHVDNLISFFPGICQTSEDFYARMVFWMCLSAMLRFNRIWNFHISCEMFPMFKRICNPISNAAKFIESEWNWDYRAWFYQYSFNQYSISLLKDNLADTKHMAYKAGPVLRLFLKWQKNQVRGGKFSKSHSQIKKTLSINFDYNLKVKPGKILIKSFKWTRIWVISNPCLFHNWIGLVKSTIL